ncbi:MAG: cadherin-like beta sandwich domain-containing protein [Spirochaetes bacterium]|nr:cadherin-like beta sandwich domain-containing protein [Spirochaetota bacterium]
MQKIIKRLGLFFVVSAVILANGCEYGEIGTFFIPDIQYSSTMSNTDLKILTLTGVEGATGTVAGLALTPAFSPSIYNYNVSIEPLVTGVTVVAVADDERSSVAINTLACTSRSITVSTDTATVLVRVTAPDGVTVKTYQINISRSFGLEESRLLNFEVFDENDGVILLSPQFDPDVLAYQLRVAWNDYYVKVRPTSISAFTTVKIDGKKVNSGEKDLVILSELPVGDSKTTQTVTVTSTASNGDVSTYTFTISRLAQELVTDDNAYLSSLKVTIGASDSIRQIYQDSDGNFFPDNTNPFDKEVYDYSCVVFGFTEAKVVITPADPTVSSLKVDTVEMSSLIQSGKLTVDVTWDLGDPDVYSVRTMDIEVISNNGLVTRNYSLKLRLLNVYEFYYGLYGPVGRANKASWGAPGSMPNWSNTYPGSISGNMVWSLTWVTTLSTVRNQMVYSDYDNGGWDYMFVGDNGGFMLNGTMSVIVNTSGTQTDGPQTGDITMQTPEGDAVAIQHIHLRIVSKDAVSRDATSYTTVDYMGQTGEIMYYDADPYHEHLGDGWDPDVPWTADDFWHP